MKHLLILLSLACTLRAAVPTGPDSPPVFDQSFKGFTISVDVEGTWPTTYQWYRGTATNPKKVKIPAPQGIQRELVFGPPYGIPYVSGLYVCEATNSKGSTLSKPTKVSVTKTKTAPEMQIVLRQP